MFNDVLSEFPASAIFVTTTTFREGVAVASGLKLRLTVYADSTSGKTGRPHGLAHQVNSSSNTLPIRRVGTVWA